MQHNLLVHQGAEIFLVCTKKSPHVRICHTYVTEPHKSENNAAVTQCLVRHGNVWGVTVRMVYKALSLHTYGVFFLSIAYQGDMNDVSFASMAYVLCMDYAPCVAVALPLRRCCPVKYFAALHGYLLRQHDDPRQKTNIFVCSHSFHSHGPVSDWGCCWISGMTAYGARRSDSVDATDLFPLSLVLPERGFFRGIILF